MFFVKLMNDGGPVMWVIAACAVLALFIFLYSHAQSIASFLK